MSDVSQAYEVLVIGGGPAGITLSKRLGRKFRMGVIRPEPKSMIYCAMPYAIEGLMPAEKTKKKDELVTGSGAELIRDTAEELDFDNKQVRLASGGRLSYGKLIIATGALPFIPPIPGHDFDGVMGFKTGEDLDRIMSLVQRGLTHAVVVGAGAIGVELAQALRHKGLTVTLVDMADSVLPNLLDPDMTEPGRDALTRNGINLRLGAKVTALRGEKAVREVVLDTDEVITFGPETNDRPDGVPPGLVVFAAGVKPDLRLVEGTGIACGHDGILVNSRMETNIPDVYACGDCTQFHSAITGKPTGGKLATNAVPMAKVLSRNLLGESWEYPGFVNGSATKSYEWFLGGTGLTAAAATKDGFEIVLGAGETTTQFSIMPDTKPLRVRLVAERKTGRVLGGQVVSGEPVCGKIDLITLAIQQQMTARQLIDFSYSAQPYQSFFPAANAIVLAAEDVYNNAKPLQE